MCQIREILHCVQDDVGSYQNTKKKFKDMSIKRLQKKAGWGDSTLDMILMADF
jgi:hypothetical protein